MTVDKKCTLFSIFFLLDILVFFRVELANVDKFCFIFRAGSNTLFK